MPVSYSDFRKKYKNVIDDYAKQNTIVENAQQDYKNSKSKLKSEKSKLADMYKQKGIIVDNGFDVTPSNFITVMENNKKTDVTKKYEKPIFKNQEKPTPLFEEFKKYNENKANFEKLSKTENFKKQQEAVDYYRNIMGENYMEYMNKKLENDDIGWYDKTLGRLVAGITPFSQFTAPLVKNEEGETYFLPDYESLKHQKVINSYDDSFMGTMGKIGSSALYEGGKLVTSAVLNKLMPGVGTATYFTDMYTNQYNNAMQEGYSSSQATAYATLGTATEAVTGKILGGTTNAIFNTGSSEMSNIIGKGLSKIIKNPRLVNVLSNAISEGGEEFVQEYIDRLNRNLTLGENNKVFSQETFEDAMFSAAVGSLTGGFSNVSNTTPQNINQVNNNVINQSLNIQQNNLLNNKYSQNSNINQSAFQFEKDNNVKVNNFKESASLFYDNSQQTHDFINNLSKLVKDKNWNVLFDDKIVNNKGQSVNAQIKTLDNGEVEVRINPNSPKSGEFLIIHEITHAIETKEMKNLVLDYASQHSDFEQALNDLKATYGTNDVSSEVLADISGQLFGNQEFINNLSLEKPNVFKRIYNSIISLANKITGNSHEALFIKDLKNKWEIAYRNTTQEQTMNNLNNNVSYSIGGIKAIKSIPNSKYKQDALNDYNKAINMQKSGEYTNEEIRQATNWFQDKNGDWKFEFSDSSIILNNNILQRDGVYKLEEVINHKYLFKLYPELKNYEVKFENMKANGSFNIKDKRIRLNNNLLKSSDYSGLKGTILHETQHAIQYIEDFETGTTSKLSKKAYYNKLGEIEANDTKTRFMNDYTKEDRKNIAPESSKLNPLHSNYNNYMRNRGTIDKIKDAVYPLYGGLLENAKKNQEVFSENKGPNSRLVDGRGLLDNSSFSFDENAKRYDDLKITNNIEFFKKENGDIRVSMLDSNSNLVNQLDIYSKQDSIKQFGENIGNYIYTQASDDFNKIYIGNDINNTGSETDYFMNHRPTETGLTADNLINQDAEVSMPTDVYEHPEYYSGTGSQYLRETMQSLNKVRNKPDAKVTIYRATTGNKINKGDWVTLSKGYAENHNKSNLNGKGNIISLEVKAKDIQFAGDDLNEFGYFPNGNIKNSISNTDKWKKYLDKNYKPTGTRTNMNDIKIPTSKDINKVNMPPVESNQNNNKTLNPIEISQLTPEDANTTPNLPKVNRNTINDGKSKFAKNIENKVNMLNEEQKTQILSDNDSTYYDTVTNKESLERAFDRLEKNNRNETMNWFNKPSENANSTDVAEGWILLKQYADSKNYDGMVEVAKKLREIGTKAGQTVQAFNIMERMTPEGMVKYAQSELQEAWEKMRINKTEKWIDKYRADFDLKPDEVQFIMDTMKEISAMEEGYDKRVKLAEIQKLMTDKLPPAKGSGIKSWMRISMLFNPKTQVRNVAGNAIIMPVNSFGDLFASYADKIISKKTGVRTTGKTNIKAMLKGMKEGAYQATNDYKKGINTKDMSGNRFEITEGKNFNDKTLMGKSLNRVEGMLNYVMDAGDRVFSQAAFENSLQNQMVLNNTTEITQDMLDIARTESLQRTWNDNNSYTKFVLDIRRMMNKINIPGMETYGLGDILIPFAKTPANLTKAIVDYSPLGLVNTIVEGNNLRKSLSNGQFTPQMQHKFVQDLGKATAGTMLYVLGYALAKSGRISGESDDDKDVSNFLKNTLGVSSYSIKFGNKSFTYDWAQPIAAPLSIMANVVNSKKNKGQALTEAIVGSLDTAGSILLEQSFVQSINDVLNDNDGVVSGLINEMLELPSRAVPTFSKQIADMVDDTQRTSFEYGKPIQSAINSFKAKIPFVSKTLAPTVDSMGREVQKYGGKNNIFNVFLNPANVNTENISESAKEIYRLYKEVGDNTIMPRVAPYYINKNGEKITLDSKQRAKYQKTSGDIIEKEVKNLLSSKDYASMSDKKKSDAISDIVNYSYNIAQKELLGLELSNTYQKAYDYSKVGNISEYYTFKNSIDNTDSDTKRESIKKFLTNSNLSDKKIAKLYGNYYSSESTLDTLLTLNIPIKEFIKLDSEDIQGKYNTKTGKTISGSKKQAVMQYVNSLNLSIPQKAILIKMQYNSFDSYDKQIVNYVNELNKTINDKKVILKQIGFDDFDKDVVNYINSQGLTIEEKESKLKDLGFTIRDGRVYW